MKFKDTKFTGDLLDEIDIEDLVSKPSDLLLSSGFGNPYSADEAERTMQALHDAILDALFNGGVLPEETIGGRWLLTPLMVIMQEMRAKLEELIQQIIERMGEQGATSRCRQTSMDVSAVDAGAGGDQSQVSFEVTTRRSDFRPYGDARPARFARGRAATAGTIPANRPPGLKPQARRNHEFGDTLNLDSTATLLNAGPRSGRRWLRRSFRRESGRSR